MKLISLNIWGGRVYEPLIEFIKKHSQDVDIFCLQEVFDNSGVPSRIQKEARIDIFSDLKRILPEFNAYIHPRQDYEESNAIFTRKNIALEKVGDVFLFGSKNSWVEGDHNTFPVNMNYVVFNQKGKKFTICNIHGFWKPREKDDSSQSLEQSKNIVEFFKTSAGAKIICGDFNLNPDTKSVKILEENMRNLIKEYNITSTRTHFYKGLTQFADYWFVSPEVEVTDFRVLSDVVSDHLPLYLEFK